MSLFCKHSWKELARSYFPPNRDLAWSEVTNLASKDVIRVRAGVTQIAYVCIECGKFHQLEMLGEVKEGGPVGTVKS